MLPFHPYADLFPLIEGEHFDALVADVKANDVREKIVVWEGAILDGRNRYRAALAAGLIEGDDGPDRAKYFTRFVPAVDGDPLAFVISKNLNRRHLDESQRAMVAARLATMRQGERTDIQAAQPSANLPKVSQSQAAETLSISERTLRAARRVRDHGEPDLVRAVERGRLAVSIAEKASHLAPEIQRKIAAEAEAGNANAARTVVKREARDEKERALSAVQLAAPEPIFGCVLEDYEWDFEVYSRDTGMDRHAANHYPVSADAHTAAEIVKRTEERMRCAAPDCVIGSWCTVPHLQIALDVMRLRGFIYKSSFVGVKHVAGTGYWNRNKHEIFLVGVRGNVPAPAMGTQFESVIDFPRAEHSVKPDWQYEFFERHWPHLRKIELNARRARPGWVAYGLEAPRPAAGHDSSTDECTDEPAAPQATSSPAPISDDGTQASVNAGREPEPIDNLDIPSFLKRNADNSLPQQGQ